MVEGGSMKESIKWLHSSVYSVETCDPNQCVCVGVGVACMGQHITITEILKYI